MPAFYAAVLLSFFEPLPVFFSLDEGFAAALLDSLLGEDSFDEDDVPLELSLPELAGVEEYKSLYHPPPLS